MKKVIYNVIAIILLVTPARHLIRGIISQFLGKPYIFSIFGISDVVVVTGCIVFIILSFLFFYLSKKRVEIINIE